MKKISKIIIFLLITMIMSFAVSGFVITTPTGGDCSLVGKWDKKKETCKLNTDVTETIEINSSDVTLDCKDHKITGTGSGTGVLVHINIDRATIKNCEVSNFFTGIRAESIQDAGTGNGHKILSNFVHDIVRDGIFIDRSGTGHLVKGNTVLRILERRGIFINRNNGSIEVTGNTVSNTGGPGIFINRDRGGGKNVASLNTVSNTARDGIRFNNNRGGGNVALSNTVTNTTRDGISLIRVGGGNIIADNQVRDSGNFNILIDDTNRNTVTGNTVSGADFLGIALFSSSDNLVADNDISDTDFFGIEIAGESRRGIFSSNNTVTNNKIRHTFIPPPGGFGGGMFLVATNDNLITSNDIDATLTGVLIVDQSDRNTIRDNKITATGKGMAIGTRLNQGGNDDNLLVNNVIKSGDDGIHMKLGARNRAEGNTIRMGGGAGIVVNLSNGTELVQNDVNKNDGDGLVLLSSPTTEVTLNDIWLNSGFAVRSDTAIELSVNSKGNWWHGNCDQGLFIAGVDSNATNVVDSNPYNGAVAHIPDPNEPTSCPGSSPGATGAVSYNTPSYPSGTVSYSAPRSSGGSSIWLLILGVAGILALAALGTRRERR